MVGNVIIGDYMKVYFSDLARVSLHLTAEEIEFFKREAKENSMSVEEMIKIVFELLCIEGYATLTGKE